MFEYLNSTSPAAIIQQFNRGGNAFTNATERELLQHPRVGNDAQRLVDAVDRMASNLSSQAANLSAQGFEGQAIKQSESVVGPFRLMVESVRREENALQGLRTDLYSPHFPEGSEPAIQVAQHSWWRELSMPQKLAAAKDPEIARIGVAFGEPMSAMPKDIFERMRRDMATEQLAERILRDTSMRTAPTADNPIGGAPDIGTARANAAERLDRLDDEAAMLARVPAWLARVVIVVALMTGESREAAFARLGA